MSIDLDQSNSSLVANIVFQLKGGLFPLTVLQIYSNDLSRLTEQLILKIQQAPNFFHQAPIVLDLRIAARPEMELDFAKLRSILKSVNLVPVGIRNANPEQLAAAVANGFAILRDSPQQKEKEKLDSTPQLVTRNSSSKLITDPVRSGQQIYAPDGDLIIVNHVSPGSELIADGSIHVYGALRGRALAGINGNQEARIFCHSLEAELVSVAGSYKISEDIERQAWKIAAQVYIKQDRLQISAL